MINNAYSTKLNYYQYIYIYIYIYIYPDQPNTMSLIVTKKCGICSYINE